MQTNSAAGQQFIGVGSGVGGAAAASVTLEFTIQFLNPRSPRGFLSHSEPINLRGSNRTQKCVVLGQISMPAISAPPQWFPSTAILTAETSLMSDLFSFFAAGR